MEPRRPYFGPMQLSESDTDYQEQFYISQLQKERLVTLFNGSNVRLSSTRPTPPTSAWHPSSGIGRRIGSKSGRRFPGKNLIAYGCLALVYLARPVELTLTTIGRILLSLTTLSLT